MSQSTDQIEREVEMTRANVEDTVDALREKMSLGRSQIRDHLRAGAIAAAAGGLVRGLQTKANPIPLALIGIGLAWLMSTRQRPANSQTDWREERYPDSLHPATSGSYATGNGLTGRVSQAGETIREGARHVTGRVGETVSSAAGGVAERVRGTREATSSAMQNAGETAAGTYSRVTDRAAAVGGRAQRTFYDVLDQEPLIIAGLGLAIGAAIGALLPPTETEDRLVGETRDRLKSQAGELAREQWEKTKDVAEETIAAAADTAKQTAKEKGLGTG